MEEEILPELDPETPVEVVDIQFRQGQKVYFFSPAGIECHAGDHLIIDTARGPEFGFCTAGNHTVHQRDVVPPLRNVLRKATARDEQIVEENKENEKKAYDICMQKITEHGLDMQLVSAEYAFDGSKILFFFTADERVDFRELVKNLASALHTRIELRQIGVRDKAKMVGGLGICGRPFCCASFLDDFQPVSIKMAKTQNLSLNPTKISGTCGRLMCCLKYEQDAYEDLLRHSPKLESLVDTADGRGTVVEIDLLRERVKVRMENQPETVNVYANSDIAVLRNGKAKNSDAPIPADLAPISGALAAQKIAPRDSEDTVKLDPIRFRYSTESVTDDEQVSQEAEVEEQPVNEVRAPRPKPFRPHARNRRPQNSERAPSDSAPKAESSEKTEPAGTPAEKPEGGKKEFRRRPNFRRNHKPRPPKDGGNSGSAE